MAVGPVEVEDAFADDSLEMNEAGDKFRVAQGLQDAIAAGGALSDAAPTQVSVVPAAPGAADDAARSDHVHNVATATATALAVGGANAEGVSPALARADHKHALPAFGTTAGTFVQGNDARLSDARTPAPHAATHAPGSADAIATAAAVALTPGGVNAAGSAATLARSDHVHALPAFGTTTGTFAQGNDARFVALADTTPVAVAVETPTPGVGVGAARYDHKHAAFVGTPVAQFPGGVNAQGVSIALARADHVHALPAFGTTAGTFCQGNDIRLTQMTVNPATTGLRLAPTADDSIPADGTFSIVYLAPVESDVIALYLGGSWGLCVASSVSYTLAGHTAGTPFDLFAWLDTSGTPAVKLEAVNWASPTARATPLARLFGVLCKSGDATRRYIGTVRPRSATTYRFQRTNDIGTGSAGIDLWNVANRRQTALALVDAAANHSWTTSAWRQWKGSANSQIDVITGLAGDAIDLHVLAHASTSNAGNTFPIVGIGIDGSATVALGTTSAIAVAPGAPYDTTAVSAMSRGLMALGAHSWAWLEYGGPNMNFFGTSFSAAKSGMVATIWY